MNRISLRSIFAAVAVFALILCFRHQLIRYLVFDIAGLIVAIWILGISIAVRIHPVVIRKPIAWSCALVFALTSVVAVWCLKRCFAFADMSYPRDFPHPDWLVETSRCLFAWDGSQPNPQALDGTTTLYLLAGLISWSAVCFFVRAGINHKPRLTS